MEKLITITELSRKLGLNKSDKNNSSNYILRYWEKEFKQIKPKILNGNRRYYNLNNIEVLKKVHFLLKEQGMTINGVKKVLNGDTPLKLDENFNHSIKTENFKNKLIKISNIIKELKKTK